MTRDLNKQVYILASLILVSLLAATVIPASASSTEYGRSVEDLVGVFSIEKTIRIGSSSEDFTSAGQADPLSPPLSPSLNPSGPMADDQAPSLAGLTIEPQMLLANSSRPINITLHAIDDQAFYGAEARLTGPEGMEEMILIPAENITAGSTRDGLYRSSIILPSNALGYWHIQSLTLVDRWGNRRAMMESALKERGLPTEIWVT